MRVLLVSNPKTAIGFDRLARLPNLGLASIAGNLDRTLCEVRILDLTAAGRNPGRVLKTVLRRYQPEVVGLSCMVFQYPETLHLARMVKAENPASKVVIGGYHPTVEYDRIVESDDMRFIDYLLRREGEYSFGRLLRALQGQMTLDEVPALSYRQNGAVIHTPNPALLDLKEVALPDRNARILRKGFHTFGYPADVIETSRGCVYDCSFCSIREMYGKSFRTYKIERILEDIRDARSHGARAIAISDDNITIHGKRYLELCEAIIDAGLDDLRYSVQASVRGIKQTPELAAAMARSGTKWVFLGIENAEDKSLHFLEKDRQFSAADTEIVVRHLRELGIIVIGGFIVGNPDDDEEALWANYHYAKRIGVDIPIFFILNPLPKTPLRRELLEKGLITNPEDYTTYDGFHANVRTKHLSPERLFEIREEMGWKYPLDSGAIWRLIREFPWFFARMIPGALLRSTGDMLGYVRGLRRKEEGGRRKERNQKAGSRSRTKCVTK